MTLQSANTQNLHLAFAKWRQLLGMEHVLNSDDAACDKGLKTFGENVSVSGTLLPENTWQVARICEIASEHAIDLHPVSRGANWGLGSRAPAVAGSVIIDLSRLDGITGFDETQGVVHIGPGVTFRQLYEFISEKSSDYFLPTIGGPVTASVLANALDRGDATFCHRWESISDLTVVLADGRVINTGHAAYTNSQLAGCGISPYGPIIDGLFSQGNLGIVPGAWLRLEPLPSNISAMVLDIDGMVNLPDVLDLWRRLQRDGQLPDRSMTMWNGIKMLAREGVRDDYTDQQLKEARLGKWRVCGYVVGETKEHLQYRHNRIAKQFSKCVDSVRGTILRVDHIWQEGGKDVFAVPKQVNLKTLYWHKNQIAPSSEMNPDNDNCGAIWLCLVLPFDGQRICDFFHHADQCLSEAGVDLNIGLEAASFRAVLMYLTISFDRTDSDEEERALATYRLLQDDAIAQGYAPYRIANGAPLPGGHSENPVGDYLRQIKSTADPNAVLSRGRVGI